MCFDLHFSLWLFEQPFIPMDPAALTPCQRTPAEVITSDIIMFMSVNKSKHGNNSVNLSCYLVPQDKICLFHGFSVGEKIFLMVSVEFQMFYA